MLYLDLTIGLRLLTSFLRGNKVDLRHFNVRAGTQSIIVVNSTAFPLVGFVAELGPITRV